MAKVPYQIEHKTSEVRLSGGALERLWSLATFLHPTVQKDCRHEGHGRLMRKDTGVLHILFPVRGRTEGVVLPPRGVRKEAGRAEMEARNRGRRAECSSHWNRVSGCTLLQGPQDAALLSN